MAAQEKLYFALMILSANATLNFTVNAVVLQKERVKKLKMNRLSYKTRRNNSQSSNLSNIMYIKMTQLELKFSAVLPLSSDNQLFKLYLAFKNNYFGLM